MRDRLIDLTASILPLIAGVALVFPGAHGADLPMLHADLSFVCKWWSEAQMEGLNPNAPPPKNTEVRIAKWGYSDPIGVPHPDVVDVVLALKNDGSQAMSGLEIEFTIQWRIGPLRTAARAVWADRAVLKKFQEISVGSAATQTFRIPVDLKTKMDTLYKQAKWPHTLRITATVQQPGAITPVARSQTDLAIRPAD
jgi:hypothetical protein